MSSPEAVTRLRMPRSALVAVAVLVVCLIPMAAVVPWLAVLYVVPLVVGVFVWRSGVDLDDDGVLAQAAFGSTFVPWEQVAGLQIRRRGELWLARRNGTAVRLPVLRSPQDLPRLHAASGGRLGVPSL